MANFFTGMINAGIRGLGAILSWVVNLLPASPFQLIDNSPIQPFIATFNWFVPLNTIIAILELWLIAVGTYYLYMVILRWVKLLG